MKKTFDCVEMKRMAQKELRRETDSLSREELVEYWRQKSREFEMELYEARHQKIWQVREAPDGE